MAWSPRLQRAQPFDAAAVKVILPANARAAATDVSQMIDLALAWLAVRLMSVAPKASAMELRKRPRLATAGAAFHDAIVQLFDIIRSIKSVASCYADPI